MQLLKVGNDHIINLDQIIDVKVSTAAVHIYFAAGGGTNTGIPSVRLTGQAALDFIGYIRPMFQDASPDEHLVATNPAARTVQGRVGGIR